MRKDWMMVDEAFASAWALARPFTMTSPERGYALWRAVEHVARNRIAGALVECGCWRGGSSILIALAATQFGIGERKLLVFDTFDGMTEASARDTDVFGRDASALLAAAIDEREEADIWAVATLDATRRNFEIAGVPASRATFVKGDVRKTLHETDTGPIALLRLDTDFYDSTYVELDVLYPRLAQGGPLLVDDYGHWRGARAAVDEFFSKGRAYETPLLTMIDYTGAIGVKLDGARQSLPKRLFGGGR